MHIAGQIMDIIPECKYLNYNIIVKIEKKC